MSVIYVPHYTPSSYPLRYSQRMTNYEFLRRIG